MKDLIRELIQQALSRLHAEGVLADLPAVNIVIEHSKDKKHGDFASNIALVLAKPARLAPRVLAEKLLAALPADEQVSQVEIAGPGFLNFYQNTEFQATRLDAVLADPKLGVRKSGCVQRVVIDISSPNLAKEMHVGHLRSTLIGDAVGRVLEFLGDTVIRQNHVGDWGTQFGMLLAYMEEKRSGDSEQAELADLEEFYRAAKKRFDESPEFANRARELVVALQAGDADCLRLWQRFKDISLAHCQAVYDRLGVALGMQDVMGESAYNDDLPKVIQALDEKGLLIESDGARCVFMGEFKTAEGQPLPLIVQKQGGGYLYATTDLAACRYRAHVLGGNRLLYFVDQRQALHFQMVFACARLAGFVPAQTELEFMGFGTMNGEDGRPFKTRSGGTVKLTDLLDEAESRALALVQQKNPELPEGQLHLIARAVGIGAVKYADLSRQRSSDYSFSFERMLSFEGNTAPYLLYAYARIASLFARAGLSLHQQLPGQIRLISEEEQALAGALLKFSEVLNKVAERGMPHLLCSYLYDLAGLFSSFYENCPVLGADDQTVRQSRLQLTALSGRTLAQGLNLLGLQTLERM
ncbi:arginine--tRNA ligase [Ventosimonas gracilis]|uniref:Arginine--tRNA ligase n=1 Tax=Ventosimonas gracilis TaxID=1680762 RepID=A0A139SWK2_9GAMM|nr:arginine--tRNA ligase [Ventosimonas gracilis]KXU38987.1 arginine--tRNA ligase [Ventosimonas gracilis]